MTNDATPSGDSSPPEPAADTAPHRSRHRLAPLPIGVRLLVLFVGGLLILIGFAGLLLPGIQGILTLVLGAAILSLASDWVYKLQMRVLNRWPRISERIEGFRHRVHGWLSRSPAEPEEEPTEPHDSADSS